MSNQQCKNLKFKKKKIDKSSKLLQFVKQNTDVGRPKLFILPWPVQHTHTQNSVSEHMQDMWEISSAKAMSKIWSILLQV